MSAPLYLDTARLGLMSPTAQQHQTAFARFAGDPHGLLYFREFLTHGVRACPPHWAQALRGLHAWRGTSGLAQSVRRLTAACDDADVVFASRSATLMRLAAGKLATRCRRVLVTDLLWAPYRRLLTDVFRRAGRDLFVCPLRASSLLEEAPSDELADRVCTFAREHDCDGLAAPLIDHRGVTLPIGSVTRRLAERLRYFVVDASQALGHVPVDVQALGCDFLIAGAHKWVGGYHPLGVGVTAESFRLTDSRNLNADPLLRLTQETNGALPTRHGETAAILPLLTAAGAVADLERTPVEHRLAIRQANRKRLALLLSAAGWRTVRHDVEHHGILLARPPGPVDRRRAQAIRRTMVTHGVVATVYTSGLTRFSAPESPLPNDASDRLVAALFCAARRMVCEPAA